MDSIDRIGAATYVPTDADILHSRSQTVDRTFIMSYDAIFNELFLLLMLPL